MIVGIKPLTLGKCNFPCCNLTRDGHFTLKRTYELLYSRQNITIFSYLFFLCVWIIFGVGMTLNCCRTFSQKLIHNRLLTNAKKYSRGISIDNIFPCYRDCPKIIMHMLRDCDEVKDFWNDLINSNHQSQFFSFGLDNQLDLKLSNNDSGRVQS